MRRTVSATIALLGVALGLSLGLFVPSYANAQGSILPTEQQSTQGVTQEGKQIENCVDLREALEYNAGALEGEELALKIRCGRMMLMDLPHYFKHALSFVLNIIGTLAVIAVIRAGYIFMLSKDKDYSEGRKAVVQVIIGLVVAALSFTAAQIVLRFLFAVSNAS